MRIFKTHAALEAALALDPCKTHRAFRFLPEYMPAGFICGDCGETHPFKLGGGTGYGTDSAGAMFCYGCGAERCAAELERDGKGCLYLSPRTKAERDARNASATYKLTDWTGEMSIPVYGVRKGSHNLAGTRYDVWFKFRGREWHGVQYGENTQLCHVRRLKESSK